MPQFSSTGIVWTVSLNETETNQIPILLGSGSPLATLAGPLAPAVFAAIGAAIPYVKLTDTLGGGNGVDINGVVGATGVIVTPHASGLSQKLVQAGRLAVSVRTVVEFLVEASVQAPNVGGLLGVGAAAAIFAEVAKGTPLGWAISVGLGLGINAALAPPDPNAHGGVHADRAQVGQWERFYLGQLGSGNHVAMLSWQGFFSAQGGGGGPVYANRPKVGDWETWTLVDNHDGTVSFQAFNGRYLTALNGGDSYCMSDRTAIGAWERFFLVSEAGGAVALKTHDKGKFLSVQPGD